MYYNGLTGGPLDDGVEPCDCDYCLQDEADEYAHDNHVPESQVV